MDAMADLMEAISVFDDDTAVERSRLDISLDTDEGSLRIIPVGGCTWDQVICPRQRQPFARARKKRRENLLRRRSYYGRSYTDWGR